MDPAGQRIVRLGVNPRDRNLYEQQIERATGHGLGAAFVLAFGMLATAGSDASLWTVATCLALGLCAFVCGARGR